MLFWLLIPAVGLLLECALLLRAGMVRIADKYPFFYIYIGTSFVGTIVAVAVRLRWSGSFETVYWLIQFATLVLGYGILLEILNHVLAPYPGAERFARVSGIVAFVGVACFAFIATRFIRQESAGTLIEFERDLRSVQAVFISGLLAVIFYYGIAMGRNMKGMILGYGLYIMISLLTRAAWAYTGDASRTWNLWNLVQPVAFDASLLIWLLALWSYCANPVPDHTIHLEEDYEAMVARTKTLMGSIRAYLGKARA